MMAKTEKIMDGVEVNRLGSTLGDSFRDIILEMAARLRERGVVSLASHDIDHLPCYAKLAAPDKKISLERAREYLNYLRLGGEKLSFTKEEVRAFQFSFKIRLPEEVFDLLENDDVVEVYTLSRLQVWRNFNFFKVCSYTLEEMFCEDWPERYVREESVMQIGLVEIQKVMDPSQPAIYYPKVPVHRFYERNSNDQLVLEANFHLFARAMAQAGDVPLWFVASKVRRLGKLKDLGDPFGPRPSPLQVVSP